VYPPAKPGRQHENVLGAVEAVVKERYPMAATFPKSDSVLAITSPKMMGVDRTRKQVHVWVRRNYTGNWDADVSVRLVTQVNDTRGGTHDPGSPYVTNSRPMATSPRWHTLQHLTGEEQELHAAILARLNG
jgi:hypothetical protein